MICCRTFHSSEKIEIYNFSNQCIFCFIIKSSWNKYLSNVYDLQLYLFILLWNPFTVDTEDDGDAGGDNQITEKSICIGDGKAAELMQSAIRDLT